VHSPQKPLTVGHDIGFEHGSGHPAQPSVHVKGFYRAMMKVSTRYRSALGGKRAVDIWEHLIAAKLQFYEWRTSAVCREEELGNRHVDSTA